VRRFLFGLFWNQHNTLSEQINEKKKSNRKENKADDFR
jgi:hypothetical protein